MPHYTFYASNEQRKTGTDARAGDTNRLHSCILTPNEQLSCRVIAVSKIVSLTLCNMLLGFRLRVVCHLETVCWFSFPPSCNSHRLLTLVLLSTHAPTRTQLIFF